MESVDLTIIGAGPIGIELAIAAKRAGIQTLHFDKGQIGETISWFPPMMRFFSSNERIAIADVPLQTSDQSKCTREEYLAYLRILVRHFDLDIRTYEQVTAIERDADGFTLITEAYGNQYRHKTRKIVLATGGTARHRELNIPGEKFENVSHRFSDPHRYFQRKLTIIGGHNSAVEAALRCNQAFADVTLSYRGQAFDKTSIKYWLLPELKGLIKEGKIKCHFNTIPVAIFRNQVAFKDLQSGETFEVPTDNVLIQVGFEADMQLFELAGVKLTEESQIPEHDEKTMETGVPGIYVAGTAVAGTQISYKIFLENCHVHVDRIMAALTGQPSPSEPTPSGEPET